MSSGLKRLIEQQQQPGPQFPSVPFNPNNQLAPPTLSMMGGTPGGPPLPQHLRALNDPGNVQSMPAQLTNGPAIQDDTRPIGRFGRLFR